MLLLQLMFIAFFISAIPEINPNVIKEKVVTLVKARLIRRCDDVIKDDDNKVTSISTTLDPETLFVLPSHDDFSKKNNRNQNITF